MDQCIQPYTLGGRSRPLVCCILYIHAGQRCNQLQKSIWIAYVFVFPFISSGCCCCFLLFFWCFVFSSNAKNNTTIYFEFSCLLLPKLPTMPSPPSPLLLSFHPIDYNMPIRLIRFAPMRSTLALSCACV